MAGSIKPKNVIRNGMIMKAAPKSALASGIKLIGGQCNNLCSRYPSKLRNGQGDNIYEKNAYCRRCSKFMLKEFLHETKNGAKMLCPCCHGFARTTPSTSSRNRTRKNRASKE